MSKQHDVVVIGGGHNALTLAGYLGKAGLDVCVVEFSDKVGGSTITRELVSPGFKHDWASHFHESIRGNPVIENDELGLQSKYGLKYLAPTGPIVTLVFPDNKALSIYSDMGKTCESIAQFSRRDAEAFPKYCEAGARLLRAAKIAIFSPPPSFGTFLSFLDSSDEGRDYLRVMLASPMDIAEEWFESEEIRLLLCLLAHPSDQSPLMKCGGLFGYAMSRLHSVGHALREEDKAIGSFGAIAEGGSGALADALAACIKDYGGTIITSAEVKSIKVENGEAKGVILANGEVIEAKKAVVSGVNVKQLFLDMLKSDELPAGFQDKVRRLTHAFFGSMKLLLALNESPKYKAGGDADNSYYLYIAPYMEEYLEIYENFRRGIPCTKMLHVSCFTLVDPTRAPDDKHSLQAFQFQPYNLPNGGAARWDEIKEEVGKGLLETIRSRTTNMQDENIIGTRVVSPADFVRANPAMINCDVNHIHMSLSQLYGNRPLPGWSHYKTPLKKLYMTAASTHPGGGVSGASGRIAAQVVMEDLGINFKKVAAK
ncbi:phytoene desaturase family protein [Chloroflexota bacterium]